MASIVQRKGKYCVVYLYTNDEGKRKQKWETYHSYKEAVKRKAEVENQQFTGAFVSPSKQTVREFLYDFVETYGAQHWGVSMYDSCTALIKNYIDPIIGDMEVQSINARVVDTYIMKLRKKIKLHRRLKDYLESALTKNKVTQTSHPVSGAEVAINPAKSRKRFVSAGRPARKSTTSAEISSFRAINPSSSF